MNQKQKFDSIIKKKVDEAEFPFDEQNWNKLSMQLDAERRLATNRGWGKFLFLGLLFLGITSASIAVYKIQGPFGIKDAIENSTSSNTNGSSSQAQGENENNYKHHSKNNLLASTNSSESNLTSKYNDNGVSSTGQSSNSDAALKATNENTSANSSNETSEKNNSVYAITKNKKLGNSSNSSPKGKNVGLNDSSSKTDEANEMGVSDRSKSDLAGGIILDHTVLDRIDSKLLVVYSNRNVKLGALKIPSWYDEDYHRKGKKRLSFLNAEVGGAYLLGWNSKHGKDGRGLNWYAGVNYGKFLNKKIGLSVGSQFYNIGNIDQSFYESSKSVYGLGSTSTNTIITAKSLFYFSVPLKVYYSINPSNQIGASVNPSFLFSSKNVVENYRLTDGIKSNEIKANSSGIYEGVRLNNILVSAFYRMKLNKRMYLNAEALYGVRDIFKNTASNNYSQKPVGFRLGIQYTLFEK